MYGTPPVKPTSLICLVAFATTIRQNVTQSLNISYVPLAHKLKTVLTTEFHISTFHLCVDMWKVRGCKCGYVER